MCGTGSLLLLAVAAPPALADVPPLDRARPHFYGAVADRDPVTVAWAAAPAGGDIALTLTVRGAANPAAYALRLCSLVDGIGYDEFGRPQPDREFRYNWFWIVQRINMISTIIRPTLESSTPIFTS